MTDNQTSVGPPTEKTLENVRRAKAFSAWVGPRLVEWKFRTGQWHWLPVWQVRVTEWWNQGPVLWQRGYWLCGGISIAQSLEERRVRQEMSELFCGEGKRRWPNVERRKGGIL